MTIATFDPTAFKIRYPQFVNVADVTLQAIFEEVGVLYLDNSNCSIVKDIAKRTMLLWLLVAHVAYLNGFTSVNNEVKPVGRLSSATEGSVSINLENLTPGSASWFQQTQWGSSFWQATTGLRSMRYFPQPTRY
jgi:hypothetical protein